MDPTMNGEKQTALETRVEGVLTPSADKLDKRPPKLMGTSLPVITRQEKLYLARVMTDDRQTLNDEAPIVVPVTHYVWMQEERTDQETGEVYMGDRLTVIAPDGRIWSTGSDSALDNFDRIIAIMGRPPWEPPIEILFKKVKTRLKRDCLICTPAVPSAEPSTTSPPPAGSQAEALTTVTTSPPASPSESSTSSSRRSKQATTK